MAFNYEEWCQEMAQKNGKDVAEVTAWTESVLKQLEGLVCQPCGVVSPAKPYITATTGLHDYDFTGKLNKSVTAAKFNVVMEQEGYLKDKLITEKGKKYGVNLPANPTTCEVKAFWYADTFAELVDTVMPVFQKMEAEAEELRKQQELEKANKSK